MSITPNQFSQEIGKNREFNKKNNRRNRQRRIAEYTPQIPAINIMWIITGEGEKFLSPDNSGSNDNNLTNYLKGRK